MHGYRNQLRLRAALESLRDPRVDLSGLALDLGFSSHSHFTVMFRRSFGCPPSQFRRVVACAAP
jgi:AraC-like DNA-binding protein